MKANTMLSRDSLFLDKNLRPPQGNHIDKRKVKWQELPGSNAVSDKRSIRLYKPC